MVNVIGTYEVVSDVETPECSLRLLRLGKDKSVDLHIHRKTTQHYYILEGSVEVITGSSARRLNKYESVRVPAGTPHGVRSDRAALVLSISIPPMEQDDQHPWP